MKQRIVVGTYTPGIFQFECWITRFPHGFGLDWNYSKEKSPISLAAKYAAENIDDNRMEARFDAIRKARMFLVW